MWKTVFCEYNLVTRTITIRDATTRIEVLSYVLAQVQYVDRRKDEIIIVLILPIL